MTKYVLFGTDSIARKLIRSATERNFRILCPIPHPPHTSEQRNYERISLIRRLGGEPILYNFSNKWNPAAEHAGHEGLHQIFKGTKGVIWAIDPEFQELGSWGYYRDRPQEYLRDFRSAISAMNTENGPTNFVSLIPHQKEMTQNSLSYAMALKMEKAVIGQQNLNWAFVPAMNGNLSEWRSHINSTDENMIQSMARNLTVTTVMHILEKDDFNGKFFALGAPCDPTRVVEDVKTVQEVEGARLLNRNRMGTSSHFVS
jgi:hypothetical protein